MGRFKNLPDGSRTIWAAVKEHKDRQRNLIIGAILALGVAGGGGYAIFRYLSAEAAVRVVDTWSALSHCVLGAPTQSTEKPSVRFRAMQLTGLTLSDLQRSGEKKDKEPWPERCAPLAHAFQAALKDAGRAEEGKQDLAHWAEQLAVGLKQEGAYGKDLSEPIDQVWDLATKAGIELKAQPDAPGPPEPAQALTMDKLAQSQPLSKKAFELKVLRPELNPAGTLRLVVTDKDVERAPMLCEFKASGPSAECKTMPEAVADATRAGAQLLGTADDDAKPLLFAGDRGGAGVLRADGERIAEADAFAGYQSGDGSAVAMGLDKSKKGLQLVRVAGGKTQTMPFTPASFQLKPAELDRDVTLLWGQLVVRGKSTTDQIALSAAEVTATSPIVGPPAEIGVLDDATAAPPGSAGPLTLSGCRSSEATVLRATQGNAEFVSFRVGGKWTRPSKILGLGGGLSCRKTEATITRVTQPNDESPLKTQIAVHQCGPSSCESQSLTLEQLLAGEQGLAPAAVVAATGFDGKLLVVWLAGSRGGLRMRLGTPSRIAKEPDVILLDDLLKDGTVQKNSSLFDVRLFSFERYALVVLNTSAGVYALRIEPDGKFAPVDVGWN